MESSGTADHQEMNVESANAANLACQELANESADSASIDDGDGSIGQPEAKYKELDKVYVRDTDGLLYAAIIRRALYGPIYHQQVQVGMTETEVALDTFEPVNATTESWQYFVHFLMWNVNWDRWIQEDKVLPMSDETKKYAEALAEGHKALRTSLTQKAPGKKSFQNLNTAAFLPEWRKTLDRIDRQFLRKDLSSTVPPIEDACSTPTRAVKWNKSAIQTEMALRNKGLISKKFQPATSTIFLPFTLKKVLVEQWEIINQCGMVAKIPAEVSIREALALYLKSKESVLPSNTATQIGVQNNNLSVEDFKSDTHQATMVDPSISSSVNISMEELHPATLQDEEKEAEDTTVASLSKDKLSTSIGGDMKQLLNEEWVKLSEGIIQLFDEALPNRLLYKNEMFQLQVIEAQADNSPLSYSDIYGCEHLLRLLVRLPSLMEEMMIDEESRPIIAKTNDFVRFMYKNQTLLFQQAYRKLSAMEQQVREKEETQRAQKRQKIEGQNQK